MKCLCGYEFTRYNGKDKPFIELFFAERVKGYINFDNVDYNFSDNSDYRAVYACPMCGTLKIDLGEII